jgi:antitoxin CptB
MSIDTEDFKKKIIYRSRYRGTKEMDILLSSFTQKYINTLTDIELVYLCNLLDLDDENLYNFNQGKILDKKIETNKVTELFKNFVYKDF